VYVLCLYNVCHDVPYLEKVISSFDKIHIRRGGVPDPAVNLVEKKVHLTFLIRDRDLYHLTRPEGLSFPHTGPVADNCTIDRPSYYYYYYYDTVLSVPVQRYYY
jgi:hypothetical protein